MSGRDGNLASVLMFLSETGAVAVLFLTWAYYFISEVRVEGLETMDYLDNLKAKERFTEQGDAIVFESEVCI
jgi:D-hexose-6-phosphate mutarotase